MRVLYWIISTSIVYVIAAILGVIFLGIPAEITQAVWLLLLAMPFYSRPIANWLKMDLPWFK